MPQKSIQLFQPPAFEGMQATSALSVIRGASQELFNAGTVPIAFGSGVELKQGGQIYLPTSATTAIFGFSYLNEQWGQDFRTVILDGTGRPAIAPNTPIPVLTFGDIWLWSEEAVNDGDPVFVRIVAATAPNNIIGRVRKTADSTNTLAYSKARFIMRSTGAGLVKVNLGGF